jgi:hypothetical protein
VSESKSTPKDERVLTEEEAQKEEAPSFRPYEHPDEFEGEFDTGVDGDPLEEGGEMDPLDQRAVLRGEAVEGVDVDLSDVEDVGGEPTLDELPEDNR